MKHSTISDHEYNGNELIPPFMKGELGKVISLHSWSKERLPEYVWIGLLRDSCIDKKDYFKKMYLLKEYILNKFSEPIDKISKILLLNYQNKYEFFVKISEIFGNNVLDPLIIVTNYDETLREVFYLKDNNNLERIKKLNKVINLMYDRYSEFAMDVRYMVIILKLNKIKIVQNSQTSIMIEALENYPYLDYKDERMGVYTTCLSSFEGMNLDFEYNDEYSKKFYEEMYLMTDCNKKVIVYEKNIGYDVLKEKLLELRKLIIKCEEKVYNDKKDVITGNIVYIYKIVKELVDNNLGNSIISRLVLRTISEIYVNLKFLCIQGKKDLKIWQDFKDYGSGKYKLIYKRIEEGSSSNKECKHFNNELLKLFANENKSEEFVTVKFSNFAKKNVRQKFIDVGEKDLYDTYYDYDTCFTHGYWGAIRESSMLICDNASHNFHSVPDVECEQNLMCSYEDLSFLLDKVITLLMNEVGVSND